MSRFAPISRIDRIKCARTNKGRQQTSLGASLGDYIESLAEGLLAETTVYLFCANMRKRAYNGPNPSWREGFEPTGRY